MSPSRLPSPCSQPRCTAICTTRYCDAHKPDAQARSYPYNKQEWQEKREAFLNEHPICECPKYKGCYHKPGECKEYRRLCVDHVIPMSQGGKDEPGNYQTLDHWCHSRKTNQEQGSRPKQDKPFGKPHTISISNDARNADTISDSGQGWKRPRDGGRFSRGP